MDSYGLIELGVQHRLETRPKCTEELVVLIWDDRLWDPKVYPHSFKEEFNSGFYCDILLVGRHNGHLWESVDNHKNTVVSMLLRRKAQHVIHGDGFPRSSRGRYWSIDALLLDSWFGNRTCSVGSDVLPDILSNIWLIEILLHYWHHFLNPKVIINPIVVCIPNHLGTLTWRNTKVYQLA